MGKYFVMRWDIYREFVRDDSYNWYKAGHKPGTLTIKDLYYEYKDVIDFMLFDEAVEVKSAADEHYRLYSLDELCEDMNNAIQEWNQ